MWKEYNPNPDEGKRVGDCSVRALSKVLNTDWETAYALVAMKGFSVHDMPSSNTAINGVLRQNGFRRASLPDDCPDCYTTGEFLEMNPEGTFVIYMEGHVAAAEDGVVYDAWDSTKQPIIAVWYKDVEPVFVEEEE